jgi:hypothetical protein
MRPTHLGAGVLGSLLLLSCAPDRARADEMPKEYRDAVAQGLKYLADHQSRDGHWEADGGQYPVTMTGLCGLALLMEGSNLREGQYKKKLLRAVDWLVKHSQRNGQLGRADFPGDAGRYMYGHGYALLFLACVYGEEDDAERREQLTDVLTRAVMFSRDAQTTRGGWGYVSAKEGNNFDEGSVAVTQVQALCAARDAGIDVPAAAIKDAMKYLKMASDNPGGGVVYSLGGGGGGEGRPPLTAAAVVCRFGVGDYESTRVKKWLKFCDSHLRPIGDGRQGVDEYTFYYYAQVVYMLGEDGWAKLFPDAPVADRLTWKKFRKTNFDALVRAQKADGSWPGPNAGGTIYATAVYCTIMQLDNGTLPIHQRKGLFATTP